MGVTRVCFANMMNSLVFFLSLISVPKGGDSYSSLVHQ